MSSIDEFGACLAFTLKYEGGFVNNPADPGGATNKGITLNTYRHFLNPNGSISDLKAITDEEVRQIYAGGYWNVVRGDSLPRGVDLCVFDFAVNSGPSRSVKYLQAIVGCQGRDIDGFIGVKTLDLVNNMDPTTIVALMKTKRMAFLMSLGTWVTFGKGWKARVDACDILAHTMALMGQGQSQQPASHSSAPTEDLTS